MKLTNDVIKFSTDNGLEATLFSKFQDYFNHYHKKGDFDDRVGLADKKEMINFEMKNAIAKLANVGTIEGLSPTVLMTSPQYQWATFAVVGAMIDAVLPQALIDSIGIYTDVKFGGFGDSLNVRIKPRDLFVVSKGGSGNRNTEIKKQYDGNVTVTADFRDITVATSLYRVLAGEEDMAEFAMKAAKSLEVEMTYNAYDAFATAMAALPTTGSNALKVAGYTQASLVKLATTVTAWNGGKQAVIIGTKAALSQILPANTNFRYTLESNYVRMGYLKDFCGFEVIELPQVADYTTEFGLKLDDKKLYIVSPSSDKIIKGFVEGQTLSIVNAAEMSADLMATTTMKKAYGFAVATSSIAGTIELS